MVIRIGMNSYKMLMVSGSAFLLSILTPWFTFNGRTMGYFWGVYIIPYIIVQVVYILFFFFKPLQKNIHCILTELGYISIMISYLYVFLYWRKLANIEDGISIRTSFYTSMPWFWVSCILLVANFAICQLYLFGGRKQANINKPLTDYRKDASGRKI